MHNTNYWIWGYTMKKVPEKLPYMPEETYCSLETAARPADSATKQTYPTRAALLISGNISTNAIIAAVSSA